MRKIVITLILSFATVGVMAQTAKHVVLISIDGLLPEFYLDKSWNTPNLQKLKQQGVYAEAVESVFPSITYPSHTTIITGALPARHGVLFNTPFEVPGESAYYDNRLIKSPTLWEAVKKSKLTSGAVMWPVSVGAPIDYNFPVKRAPKIDQLTATRPFVTPSKLVDEMQQSFGQLGKHDFNSSNTADPTIGKMANYIIKAYKPNLMAIHFLTVDHQIHDFGKDALESRKAVATVDSLIGTVIKTVTDAGLYESTVFIITGDHGMVDNESTFAPNVLLAQNGLLTKEGWKARFNNAGGSSFLYLKDKKDKQTLEKVKDILANLPESQKSFFKVIDRNELKKLGANPDAALALAFTKGTVGSPNTEGEVWEKVKPGKASHGYLPSVQQVKTGLIVSGPGINTGGVIKEIGIKDIAPLISNILKLDFTSPDGKLIPGILK